jgi:hypothetical protein
VNADFKALSALIESREHLYLPDPHRAKDVVAFRSALRAGLGFDRSTRLAVGSDQQTGWRFPTSPDAFAAGIFIGDDEFYVFIDMLLDPGSSKPMLRVRTRLSGATHRGQARAHAQAQALYAHIASAVERATDQVWHSERSPFRP